MQTTAANPLMLGISYGFIRIKVIGGNFNVVPNIFTNISTCQHDA